MEQQQFTLGEGTRSSGKKTKTVVYKHTRSGTNSQVEVLGRVHEVHQDIVKEATNSGLHDDATTRASIRDSVKTALRQRSAVSVDVDIVPSGLNSRVPSNIRSSRPYSSEQQNGEDSKNQTKPSAASGRLSSAFFPASASSELASPVTSKPMISPNAVSNPNDKSSTQRSENDDSVSSTQGGEGSTNGRKRSDTNANGGKPAPGKGEAGKLTAGPPSRGGVEKPFPDPGERERKPTVNPGKPTVLRSSENIPAARQFQWSEQSVQQSQQLVRQQESVSGQGSVHASADSMSVVGANSGVLFGKGGRASTPARLSKAVSSASPDSSSPSSMADAKAATLFAGKKTPVAAKGATPGPGKEAKGVPTAEFNDSILLEGVSHEVVLPQEVVSTDVLRRASQKAGMPVPMGGKFLPGIPTAATTDHDVHASAESSALLENLFGANGGHPTGKGGSANGKGAPTKDTPNEALTGSINDAKNALGGFFRGAPAGEGGALPAGKGIPPARKGGGPSTGTGDVPAAEKSVPEGTLVGNHGPGKGGPPSDGTKGHAGGEPSRPSLGAGTTGTRFDTLMYKEKLGRNAHGVDDALARLNILIEGGELPDEPHAYVRNPRAAMDQEEPSTLRRARQRKNPNIPTAGRELVNRTTGRMQSRMQPPHKERGDKEEDELERRAHKASARRGVGGSLLARRLSFAEKEEVQEADGTVSSRLTGSGRLEGSSSEMRKLKRGSRKGRKGGWSSKPEIKPAEFQKDEEVESTAEVRREREEAKDLISGKTSEERKSMLRELEERKSSSERDSGKYPGLIALDEPDDADGVGGDGDEADGEKIIDDEGNEIRISQGPDLSWVDEEENEEFDKKASSLNKEAEDALTDSMKLEKKKLRLKHMKILELSLVEAEKERGIERDFVSRHLGEVELALEEGGLEIELLENEEEDCDAEHHDDDHDTSEHQGSDPDAQEVAKKEISGFGEGSVPLSSHNIAKKKVIFYGPQHEIADQIEKGRKRLIDFKSTRKGSTRDIEISLGVSGVGTRKSISDVAGVSIDDADILALNSAKASAKDAGEDVIPKAPRKKTSVDYARPDVTQKSEVPIALKYQSGIHEWLQDAAESHHIHIPDHASIRCIPPPGFMAHDVTICHDPIFASLHASDLPDCIAVGGFPKKLRHISHTEKFQNDEYHNVNGMYFYQSLLKVYVKKTESEQGFLCLQWVSENLGQWCIHEIPEYLVHKDSKLPDYILNHDHSESVDEIKMKIGAALYSDNRDHHDDRVLGFIPDTHFACFHQVGRQLVTPGCWWCEEDKRFKGNLVHVRFGNLAGKKMSEYLHGGENFFKKEEGKKERDEEVLASTNKSVLADRNIRTTKVPNLTVAAAVAEMRDRSPTGKERHSELRQEAELALRKSQHNAIATSTDASKHIHEANDLECPQDTQKRQSVMELVAGFSPSREHTSRMSARLSSMRASTEEGMLAGLKRMGSIVEDFEFEKKLEKEKRKWAEIKSIPQFDYIEFELPHYELNQGETRGVMPLVEVIRHYRLPIVQCAWNSLSRGNSGNDAMADQDGEGGAGQHSASKAMDRVNELGPKAAEAEAVDIHSDRPRLSGVKPTKSIKKPGKMKFIKPMDSGDAEPSVGVSGDVPTMGSKTSVSPSSKSSLTSAALNSKPSVTSKSSVTSVFSSQSSEFSMDAVNRQVYDEMVETQRALQVLFSGKSPPQVERHSNVIERLSMTPGRGKTERKQITKPKPSSSSPPPPGLPRDSSVRESSVRERSVREPSVSKGAITMEGEHSFEHEASIWYHQESKNWYDHETPYWWEGESWLPECVHFEGTHTGAPPLPADKGKSKPSMPLKGEAPSKGSVAPAPAAARSSETKERPSTNPDVLKGGSRSVAPATAEDNDDVTPVVMHPAKPKPLHVGKPKGLPKSHKVSMPTGEDVKRDSISPNKASMITASKTSASSPNKTSSTDHGFIHDFDGLKLPDDGTRHTHTPKTHGTSTSAFHDPDRQTFETAPHNVADQPRNIAGHKHSVVPQKQPSAKALTTTPKEPVTIPQQQPSTIQKQSVTIPQKQPSTRQKEPAVELDGRETSPNNLTGHNQSVVPRKQPSTRALATTQKESVTIPQQQPSTIQKQSVTIPQKQPSTRQKEPSVERDGRETSPNKLTGHKPSAVPQKQPSTTALTTTQKQSVTIPQKQPSTGQKEPAVGRDARETSPNNLTGHKESAVPQKQQSTTALTTTQKQSVTIPQKQPSTIQKQSVTIPQKQPSTWQREPVVRRDGLDPNILAGHKQSVVPQKQLPTRANDTTIDDDDIDERSQEPVANTVINVPSTPEKKKESKSTDPLFDYEVGIEIDIRKNRDIVNTRFYSKVESENEKDYIIQPDADGLRVIYNLSTGDQNLKKDLVKSRKHLIQTETMEELQKTSTTTGELSTISENPSKPDSGKGSPTDKAAKAAKRKAHHRRKKCEALAGKTFTGFEDDLALELFYICANGSLLEIMTKNVSTGLNNKRLNLRENKVEKHRANLEKGRGGGETEIDTEGPFTPTSSPGSVGSPPNSLSVSSDKNPAKKRKDMTIVLVELSQCLPVSIGCPLTALLSDHMDFFLHRLQQFNVLCCFVHLTEEMRSEIFESAKHRLFPTLSTAAGNPLSPHIGSRIAKLSGRLQLNQQKDAMQGAVAMVDKKNAIATGNSADAEALKSFDALHYLVSSHRIQKVSVSPMLWSYRYISLVGAPPYQHLCNGIYEKVPTRKSEIEENILHVYHKLNMEGDNYHRFVIVKLDVQKNFLSWRILKTRKGRFSVFAQDLGLVYPGGNKLHSKSTHADIDCSEDDGDKDIADDTGEGPTAQTTHLGDFTQKETWEHWARWEKKEADKWGQDWEHIQDTEYYGWQHNQHAGFHDEQGVWHDYDQTHVVHDSDVAIEDRDTVVDHHSTGQDGVVHDGTGGVDPYRYDTTGGVEYNSIFDEAYGWYDDHGYGEDDYDDDQWHEYWHHERGVDTALFADPNVSLRDTATGESLARAAGKKIRKPKKPLSVPGYEDEAEFHDEYGIVVQVNEGEEIWHDPDYAEYVNQGYTGYKEDNSIEWTPSKQKSRKKEEDDDDEDEMPSSQPLKKGKKNAKKKAKGICSCCFRSKNDSERPTASSPTLHYPERNDFYQHGNDFYEYDCDRPWVKEMFRASSSSKQKKSSTRTSSSKRSDSSRKTSSSKRSGSLKWSSTSLKRSNPSQKSGNIFDWGEHYLHQKDNVYENDWNDYEPMRPQQQSYSSSSSDRQVWIESAHSGDPPTPGKGVPASGKGHIAKSTASSPTKPTAKPASSKGASTSVHKGTSISVHKGQAGSGESSVDRDTPADQEVDGNVTVKNRESAMLFEKHRKGSSKPFGAGKGAPSVSSSGKGKKSRSVVNPTEVPTGAKGKSTLAEAGDDGKESVQNKGETNGEESANREENGERKPRESIPGSSQESKQDAKAALGALSGGRGKVGKTDPASAKGGERAAGSGKQQNSEKTASSAPSAGKGRKSVMDPPTKGVPVDPAEVPFRGGKSVREPGVREPSQRLPSQRAPSERLPTQRGPRVIEKLLPQRDPSGVQKLPSQRDRSTVQRESTSTVQREPSTVQRKSNVGRTSETKRTSRKSTQKKEPLPARSSTVLDAKDSIVHAKDSIVAAKGSIVSNEDSIPPPKPATVLALENNQDSGKENVDMPLFLASTPSDIELYGRIALLQMSCYFLNDTGKKKSYGHSLVTLHFGNFIEDEVDDLGLEEDLAKEDHTLEKELGLHHLEDDHFNGAGVDTTAGITSGGDETVDIVAKKRALVEKMKTIEQKKQKLLRNLKYHDPILEDGAIRHDVSNCYVNKVFCRSFDGWHAVSSIELRGSLETWTTDHHIRDRDHMNCDGCYYAVSWEDASAGIDFDVLQDGHSGLAQFTHGEYQSLEFPLIFNNPDKGLYLRYNTGVNGGSWEILTAEGIWGEAPEKRRSQTSKAGKKLSPTGVKISTSENRTSSISEKKKSTNSEKRESLQKTISKEGVHTSHPEYVQDYVQDGYHQISNNGNKGFSSWYSNNGSNNISNPSKQYSIRAKGSSQRSTGSSDCRVIQDLLLTPRTARLAQYRGSFSSSSSIKNAVQKKPFKKSFFARFNPFSKRKKEMKKDKIRFHSRGDHNHYTSVEGSHSAGDDDMNLSGEAFDHHGETPAFDDDDHHDEDPHAHNEHWLNQHQASVHMAPGKGVQHAIAHTSSKDSSASHASKGVPARSSATDAPESASSATGGANTSSASAKGRALDDASKGDDSTASKGKKLASKLAAVKLAGKPHGKPTTTPAKPKKTLNAHSAKPQGKPTDSAHPAKPKGIPKYRAAVAAVPKGKPDTGGKGKGGKAASEAIPEGEHHDEEHEEHHEAEHEEQERPHGEVHHVVEAADKPKAEVTRAKPIPKRTSAGGGGQRYSTKQSATQKGASQESMNDDKTAFAGFLEEEGKSGKAGPAPAKGGEEAAGSGKPQNLGTDSGRPAGKGTKSVMVPSAKVVPAGPAEVPFRGGKSAREPSVIKGTGKSVTKGKDKHQLGDRESVVERDQKTMHLDEGVDETEDIIDRGQATMHLDDAEEAFTRSNPIKKFSAREPSTKKSVAVRDPLSATKKSTVAGTTSKITASSEKKTVPALEFGRPSFDLRKEMDIPHPKSSDEGSSDRADDDSSGSDARITTYDGVKGHGLPENHPDRQSDRQFLSTGQQMMSGPDGAFSMSGVDSADLAILKDLEAEVDREHFNTSLIRLKRWDSSHSDHTKRYYGSSTMSGEDRLSSERESHHRDSDDRPDRPSSKRENSERQFESRGFGSSPGNHEDEEGVRHCGDSTGDVRLLMELEDEEERDYSEYQGYDRAPSFTASFTTTPVAEGGTVIFEDDNHSSTNGRKKTGDKSKNDQHPECQSGTEIKQSDGSEINQINSVWQSENKHTENKHNPNVNPFSILHDLASPYILGVIPDPFRLQTKVEKFSTPHVHIEGKPLHDPEFKLCLGLWHDNQYQNWRTTRTEMILKFES